ATHRPDTAALSLHDALPICAGRPRHAAIPDCHGHRRSPLHRRVFRIVRLDREEAPVGAHCLGVPPMTTQRTKTEIATEFLTLCRSEEHTSELQSRENLVCRL